MSRWRHLDLGTWRVEVRGRLRRLACPTHGVVVEGVGFARPGAHLTRDLDDLLAWLATRTDKTSVARSARVSWRTVGRACERVVASEPDPDRLDGLARIGVDEISWRKHHKYLTLVVDHDRARVVWGAPGKDAATLDGFFEQLGPERAAAIQAVSMDLGPALLKSVAAPGHAPQAVVCADPFHLVKLVGDALDRGHTRRAPRGQISLTFPLPDRRYARDFKGARWALLRNPEDLTEAQTAQLSRLRRNGGGIWRAYEMKEQFRAVFAGDLDPAAAIGLLDRWTVRASRSQLAPFVKAAKDPHRNRMTCAAAWPGAHRGRSPAVR